MSHRRLLLTILAALVPTLVAAAEPPALVSVTVKTGRTFDGLVDRASDAETLVLRCGSGGVVIHRPIAWDRVQAAESNGQPLTIDELRRLATVDDGAVPPPPANLTQKGRIVRYYPAPAIAEPEPAAVYSPPASLRIDAGVVNWDQDVENDGLLVVFEPLDADGNLAAVSGTAEITWYGGRFAGGYPDRGWRPERLGTWQVPVRRDELNYRGYLFKLPFQNLHPDFDVRMVNYSLVNVRLNVPGEGMYEASLDGIRVRPWSPFRDMLQLRHNTRWLPTESTGRGKNSP